MTQRNLPLFTNPYPPGQQWLQVSGKRGHLLPHRSVGPFLELCQGTPLRLGSEVVVKTVLDALRQQQQGMLGKPVDLSGAFSHSRGPLAPSTLRAPPSDTNRTHKRQILISAWGSNVPPPFRSSNLVSAPSEQVGVG
ncbi:hypothetical protein AAFF_G00148660 [Aldrovandia affinis]|uniref:Uncharacterized protein n=1 Tax=Aldrovandia affinis TaxID=143900 RepID=A0AAD7RPK1_9TELE|nr:hypothetical protein AAFF_G00148660 [Aldrovandia affinis]